METQTSLTKIEQSELSRLESPHDQLWYLERKMALSILASSICKLISTPAAREHVIDFLKMLKIEQESVDLILSKIPPGDSFKSAPSRPPIPAEIRWRIWERDNFTCHYCGNRRNLSVDHLVPYSKGGALEDANLVTACKPCNSSKGNTAYNTFMETILKERE